MSLDGRIMFEERIVYKVCGHSSKPDVYKSFFVNSRKLILYYEIGKITTPDIGLIMAFAQQDQSMIWANSKEKAFVVLKCRAQAYTPHTNLFPAIASYMEYYTLIKSMWDNFFQNPKVHGVPETLLSSPIGTVFCSSCEPLEIVNKRGRRTGRYS